MSPVNELHYTYDPANITEAGKDRMRFELGDTMVNGAEVTTYMSDEEITAIIETYPRWKKAKLEIIKSLIARFSYEVTTKVGPMQLNLPERLAAWEKMRAKLETEVEAAASTPQDPAVKKNGKPYFWAGMHDNTGACGNGLPTGGHGLCTYDRKI